MEYPFSTRGARPAPQAASPAEAGTLTETDPPRGPLGRVVVIIPTYNERENLDPIVARVRTSVYVGMMTTTRPSGPRGGSVSVKVPASAGLAACGAGGSASRKRIFHHGPRA